MSSRSVIALPGLEPAHCIAHGGWIRREPRAGLALATAKGESVAVAAEALAGQDLLLGRYRPLRPLGNGGSGSVWLARDVESGTDVALKIVAKEGKAGERAEREAAAVATLAHERCQRSLDVASDERHVYLSYEYVPGRTLREAIRAGDLDDRGAIEAAAQILDGLAHAHGRGIVHRDVKPANVLLADGDDVSIRLLDFGLAQFPEAETLTAVGDVPGTLAYISPERLRGDAAGPASDIWSASILLWEALAGRHPFVAPSLPATARSIAAGAPSLGEVRPDLPKALIRVLAAGLARDPARRPSAARLARALRWSSRQMMQEPLPEPEPDAAEPIIPLPTRHAPAVLAAALSALVAGWTASHLPFYPTGWWPLVALLAGGVTAANARLGLALTLAVPVLPLGNLSLGLALLYTAVATAWFCLFARHPRAGLLFALGPLLAPIAALGLVPLVCLGLRTGVHRVATALTAVLTAFLVAGIRDTSLPFSAQGAPRLALGSTEHPLGAARMLWEALLSQPALPLLALSLGAAAALLPEARRRGPWGLAVFGAALLAATLLPAAAVSVGPLVASVWLMCAALVLHQEGVLRMLPLRR